MNHSSPARATPGAVDIAIIGAGIVGLATAYKLLTTKPGLRLVVIDKEPAVARHQSSHNSGVLHSGLYYTPGSLKARTAREGRAMMTRFCTEHSLPTRQCGKLIVATRPEQLERLAKLRRRAQANGVRAELVSAERAREIEPHATGLQALWVPDAGIVDYAAVCRELGRQIERLGGSLALDTRVSDITADENTVAVATTAGRWQATVLVNCAGLHSDQIANLDTPLPHGTHIVPFRGEYYALRQKSRHLVRGLIYPVPDPSFPFLGVHFTTTVDGRVLAGPNAVLALAREGYRWRDVSASHLRTLLTDRGLRKLARNYWRTGAREIWRSLSKRAFVKALRRLVPEITAADLERHPAGVRAQALRPDGQLVDDFVLHTTRRTIHLLNAPSPAATASLAIGATLASKTIERLD